MKLKTIAEHVHLHRDPQTGIAWVANGMAGIGHSCHPNIDESGSVKGMIERGQWSKDARPVKSHGFIFNTAELVVSDHYDELARQYCQCGGNHQLSAVQNLDSCGHVPYRPDVDPTVCEKCGAAIANDPVTRLWKAVN